MAKKMILEDLARLVEQRAQGIEDKITTDIQTVRAEMATNTKDLLQAVNHVEELLKGKADTLEHVRLEYRVEKLEEKVEVLAGQGK